MNIGVFVNSNKDLGYKTTNYLIECIRKYGGKVINSDNFDDDRVVENSDVIVCLGGDGTFIKVGRKAIDNEVPLLGINLGTLGFLTDVDKEDIDIAVKRLIENDYKIEERMLISNIFMRGDNVIAEDISINDVVISRGAISRVINLSTYVNDSFIDSYPADGIIVATPIGSTGYSLSAGGPVVDPGIDLIIITPICPHLLFSRPFITCGDSVVKIVIDKNTHNQELFATIDGQNCYQLQAGDYVLIRRHTKKLKVVRMNSKNYFSILKSKMQCREELFCKNEV